MNIAITGINGFIGKALNNSLSKNHRITGIARTSDHHNITTVDLQNDLSVQRFLAQNSSLNIDIMIHLAAQMASAHHEADDSNILNINAAITQNIALIAQQFKVKQFIHFSSTSVYPNIDGLFDENASINPSPNSDCLYGLSKFNAEIMLNHYLKNTEALITHLRCGMVFGEGMPESRLWSVLRQELAESNQITLFGNGKRIINFIFIEELMHCIDAFLLNPMPGIFNVVTHTLSLEALARKMILETDNKQAKINFIAQGNQYQFRVDSTKLKSFIKATCCNT